MKTTGPKMLLRIFICAALAFAPWTFFAQQDTLPIEEVALTVRKTGFSSLGKKITVIDSATKELFRFGNAAELLAYNGSIFVKSYGPGGIATTALRGGTAEQTAVLWNGMNLQNTMLGQTDLSLLPAILFESVAVEFGPGASVWGGGAVGGSIQLGNAGRFGKALRVTASGSAGDMGQKNFAGVVGIGNDHVVNTLKIYSASSKNNYSYTDQNSREIETVRDAPYEGVGLMNELRIAAGRYSIVSLNAWWNKGDRRIASYNVLAPSKQNQHDDALRVQGAWSYQRIRYRMQLRGALFDERIDYNDSLFLIFAKNRAKTILIDNEHYLTWGGKHELHAGVSYMGTSATSANYDGQQKLTRYSLLIGNRFRFGEKLGVSINGRAEYFSATSLPLTGNLGIEYRPVKGIKLGSNVSTFYRQPTLNELYWSPGGNKTLRPESGEGLDVHFVYELGKKKVRFSVSASAFTRDVRNCILWVPGAGGNPTPRNIQEVWSRGGETTWKLDFTSGPWRAGGNVNTSYVLSTVLKSEIQNSASLGKQLIYTPRYTAGGTLSGGYRNTSLYLLAQYAGYRFISTDNSSWMDPYMVLSIRGTQNMRLSKLNFVLFVAVNNLLNEDYAVQAGRPMPLRSFETGLTIHLNHKTKNENK